MQKLLPIVALVSLSACLTPEPPVTHFSSENAISLRYSAYDTALTLTAEAIDMAVRHCHQYGKYANYKGGRAVSVFGDVV